jgi:hypothetical protein
MLYYFNDSLHVRIKLPLNVESLRTGVVSYALRPSFQSSYSGQGCNKHRSYCLPVRYSFCFFVFLFKVIPGIFIEFQVVTVQFSCRL